MKLSSNSTSNISLQHILLLRFAGKVINESATHMTIREDFADSGNAEFTIAKNRIVQHTNQKQELPDISYRDIRFYMEFPEFNFYRKPPYTILTKQRFFDVQKSVQVLQGMQCVFVKQACVIRLCAKHGDPRSMVRSLIAEPWLGNLLIRVHVRPHDGHRRCRGAAPR